MTKRFLWCLIALTVSVLGLILVAGVALVIYVNSSSGGVSYRESVEYLTAHRSELETIAGLFSEEPSLMYVSNSNTDEWDIAVRKDTNRGADFEGRPLPLSRAPFWSLSFESIRDKRTNEALAAFAQRSFIQQDRLRQIGSMLDSMKVRFVKRRVEGDAVEFWLGSFGIGGGTGICYFFDTTSPPTIHPLDSLVFIDKHWSWFWEGS